MSTTPDTTTSQEQIISVVAEMPGNLAARRRKNRVVEGIFLTSVLLALIPLGLILFEVFPARHQRNEHRVSHIGSKYLADSGRWRLSEWPFWYPVYAIDRLGYRNPVRDCHGYICGGILR